MDSFYYLVAIALSIAAGASIMAVVWTFKDQRRQIAELRKSVDSLKSNYGHTAVGRARNDIAEEFKFQLALLKNDQEIINERIAYMNRVAGANMTEPKSGGKSK